MEAAAAVVVVAFGTQVEAAAAVVVVAVAAGAVSTDTRYLNCQTFSKLLPSHFTVVRPSCAAACLSARTCVLTVPPLHARFVCVRVMWDLRYLIPPMIPLYALPQQ